MGENNNLNLNLEFTFLLRRGVKIMFKKYNTIYFETKGGVSLWKYLAREWKPGSWFTPTSTASSLFQKVVRDGG